MKKLLIATALLTACLTVPSWAQQVSTVVSVDLTRYTGKWYEICLLYTSPSPRDQRGSRMPSSA